jgi:hypothetical protein
MRGDHCKMKKMGANLEKLMTRVKYRGMLSPRVGSPLQNEENGANLGKLRRRDSNIGVNIGVC